MADPAPFERISILGLGLMGGSLGMALVEQDHAEVVGWNRTSSRAEEAVGMGAVHRTESTIDEACKGSQLVVVATPVLTIAEIAVRAMAAAPEGAVVTDVGSVKAGIIRAVEPAAPPGRSFVGGHPMCGSELAGLGAARPDLYFGATWVLTPTHQTDAESYSAVHSMATSVGASVLAVQPEIHDRFVSLVSHLPHLAAVSLMNIAGRHGESADALLKLAAGGFRDVTRIASGSASIWEEICILNADAITDSLDDLISELSTVREALAQRDSHELRARLENARRARSKLPIGPGPDEELCEIVLAVPDRPGVIAEVTTLLGSAGINIEDLGISHSLEGKEGLLRLSVAGADEAERALEILRAEGHAGVLDVRERREETVSPGE